MDSFWTKLILMPIVVAFVTIISKKWGNSIGGLVASLPWVAGPIILFITLEQGVDFTVKSISGMMVGIIGWLVFCVVYTLVGKRHRAFFSLLAGYVAYILLAIILNPLIQYLNHFQWFFISTIVLVLGLVYFPKVEKQGQMEPKKLKFEIPLRMIMITLFVLAITFFANQLGPNWSGILTPFPIMTAVLAIFTHHTQGIYQVRKTYLGLYTGIFGFSIFLFLQALLLPIWGLTFSFSCGLIINVLFSVGLKIVFTKFKLLE
jgi:hypothetical protein